MKGISIVLVAFLVAVSAFAISTFNVKATGMQFQMQPLVEGPAYDLDPSILQDSSGKIWVFFASGGRIDPGYRHVFFITSIDGGITWTEPTVFLPAYLPGVDAVYRVAAFQDSTGRFWVAWTNYWGVHDEDEIWFTTSDDGENWADAKALCRHGNKIGSFIEAEGKIWFFFSPRSNWFSASYKTTVDGGNSWSDVVPIAIEWTLYPQAIVLENGTIFVVYNHYPGTIGYCISSGGGLSWSSARFDNPETDSYPKGVEYDGKIYVFFTRIYQPFNQPPYTGDIWFRVNDEAGWGPFQQMTNEPQNFDNCATPACIRNQIWVVWGKASDDSNTQQDIWLAKTYWHIEAIVDIDPDTLNLKSNGQWITAYITLPAGYNVEDIVLETVYLDETPAEWPEIQNGVYMAKFDRAAVQASLNTEPDYESAPKFYDLTLTVTGELLDGTSFQGSDAIRVLSK